MEKAVTRLRSTPEPGRFYVITNIIEDIKHQKGIQTSERRIIEECFDIIDTVASTSILVQHIVDMVVQGCITCDDGYALLLGGLSTYTHDESGSCIRAVSHGIMDVYILDKVLLYKKEQHPLVKAWALEPRTGHTLISRIEHHMVNLEVGTAERSKRDEFFGSVEPFLMEASSSCSSVALSSNIRNCIVRMSCNLDEIHLDDMVAFLVRLMCSYGSTRAMEQEACVLDLLDVMFCPRRNGSPIAAATTKMVLEAIFNCLTQSAEQGEPLNTYTGAIGLFLPTYAVFCGYMTIPLSLLGVRFGESEESKLCFDLVSMILGSKTEHDTKLCDMATLSILECACLRAQFYCQRSGTKESVQRCLKKIEMCMQSSDATDAIDNPYVPCRWNVSWDVLYWIDAIAAWCEGITGGIFDNRSSMDLRIVQILSLLRHPSISVRLEALNLVKCMPRVSEDFSFFALPVLLRRMQACSQDVSKIEILKDDAFFLKEIMFSLSHLSHNSASVPFIVRMLQPLLDSNSPLRLQGLAYRILASIWLESGKCYSTLRITLLGCDMTDEVEVRSVKDAWVVEQLNQEKLAAVSSLINICSKDPGKGKDFVHMIHACVCSKYPILASAGLECIRLLCISDILDFPKAWKVVRRIHPDLPTNDEVASAWVSLISCALEEDPVVHEEMVRDVMELSWGATNHDSSLVRAAGYKALGNMDWEVAETLDCLRPPLAYAQLLSKEGDEESILDSYEEMMNNILSLEFADRRKQYIQLSGTISNQMKQSHNARFYKLAQSIPKLLLDEVKCGNSILPSSVAGSQVFVILNLWMPQSRKESQMPVMYQQVANELLSNKCTSCFDILVDLENAVLLCDGWRSFFHRWFASIHPEISADLADYRKHEADVEEIWDQCFGSLLSSTIINPNIPTASIAFAMEFGDVDPLITAKCFRWIFSIAQDSLQHPNIRNLCILLIGILLEKVKIHVGDLVVEEVISYILGSGDICMKHRCLALKHCFGYQLPEPLLRKGFDFILGSSGIRLRDSTIAMRKDADLSKQSVAIGALGIGIRCHLDGTSPMDMLTIAKKFLRDVVDDDTHQELIPGYLELFANALITAYNGSNANDADISECLNTLLAFLASKVSLCYKGFIALAIAKIMTDALKMGYASNKVWNIDACVSIIREHLSTVGKFPSVRENAGQMCKGLNLCLEYQMCNEKNQNESCSEENASELELASICNLDSSSAVRMGCIPHISNICKKAIDFKRNIDSQSLEYFSSSAIGYLSEVLISQSWPNLPGTPLAVSREKTITLLSCVGRAPRLPRKDWTACLRRCIRMYPNDADVHMSVVKFIRNRAAAGTFDNLRDFVTRDMFSIESSAPIQSSCLVKEAWHLALASLHITLCFMSHEERIKIVTSLMHQHARQDSLMAHAVCLGLHSLIRESLSSPSDHNESMINISLDVMVETMSNTMDCSPAAINMLCSLYRLDGGKLKSFFNEDRILNGVLEGSAVDTVQIYVALGALLIASYRLVRPEMQQVFCQSMRVFEIHPVLHTWLSCALMDSVDPVVATNLSRNYILSNHSDPGVLSIILAEGYRYVSEARGPRGNIEALAWLTTLVGTHPPSGIMPKSIRNTAIMCLVGIYLANIKDSAFSLSLVSATQMLSKAKKYFSHEEIFGNIAETFAEF